MLSRSYARCTGISDEGKRECLCKSNCARYLSTSFEVKDGLITRFAPTDQMATGDCEYFMDAKRHGVKT